MAPYAMVNKPIPSNPKTVRANTRWETLYETAFAAPTAKDYFPPRQGGGWFRHPSLAKKNPQPYKTDISFYDVEYSRVQVPEEWDHLMLEMDRNDPYIKYRDGFGERATFQSSYNDMNFHHNKIPIGGFNKKAEILSATEYGKRKEKEAQERGVACKAVKPFSGACGHWEHLRPISSKEEPVKYPLKLLNPENVDYERPLPCPEPKPYVFPKKVTEDDMRNEVRFGPRGTKGFFATGESKINSTTGNTAAEYYYRDLRPLEGTLLTINANRSIKSRVMQ